MAKQTSFSSDGADRLAAYIRDLEARIQNLERLNVQGVTFRDGTRIRVTIGKQADGKYGIKIWDSAGTLQYNNTF